jgi:hypothetical protein
METEMDSVAPERKIRGVTTTYESATPSGTGVEIGVEVGSGVELGTCVGLLLSFSRQAARGTRSRAKKSRKMAWVLERTTVLL